MHLSTVLFVYYYDAMCKEAQKTLWSVPPHERKRVCIYITDRRDAIYIVWYGMVYIYLFIFGKRRDGVTTAPGIRLLLNNPHNTHTHGPSIVLGVHVRLYSPN